MARTDHLAVPVTGGELPAVAVLPEGKDAVPFAIVIPSIFGITADLIEQMTELSAAGGIVAIDPFWRVEAGAIDYAEVDSAFARVGELDRRAAPSLPFGDFIAACEWIGARPRFAGRLVGVGIYYGVLDAVVTWHGSQMQRFLDRVSEMRCPMRHHIGGDDPVVPGPARQRIEEAFAGRDDVAITVHPGAGHGFSHRAAEGRVESAEAAAMASVVELLRLSTSTQES
jgi:carboxymethylenebutenolidase